jgi:hypothetical protein
MAFVAQWLLCLWQARAIQASWWAVLVTLVTLLALETLLMPPRRAVPQRGWPELVRACVTLVVVYWVCMMLFGGLWEGGRALGTILLMLAGWALLPFAQVPYPNVVLPLMDATSLAVGVVSSVMLGPAVKLAPVGAAAGWVHLVCALHLLLVSNRHESISVWRMGVSVVGLPLVVGLCPEPTLVNDAPWLLLALPSMGMHLQELVAEYITPIVETLCHPEVVMGVRTLSCAQSFLYRVTLL